MQPIQYGNAAAIHAKHGYGEGVEYAALHFTRTKKPVVFVPMPIGTPGVVSRQVVGGNSGTCVTAIVAGSDGILAEHRGRWRVLRGGLVGTDPIVLGLSLDGGRTEKRVRLGTATTYVDPYFGFSTTFTLGTLVTGDTIHEWHGSAPRIDWTDLATVRANLGSQSKLFRSMLVIGDLANDEECAALVSEVNAYETENDRYIYCRASVNDRRVARMTQHRATMTGTPEIEFEEVDTTGDTITRDSGSFIDDGFATGMVINVTGAANAQNNLTNAVIAGVTATVITLDGDDLIDEIAEGVAITASWPITLSAVGYGTETITRHASSGSFVADGFAIGDTLVLDDAVGTFGGAEGSYEITNVSATVLTVADPDVDFVAGAYASYQSNLTAEQLLPDWMAAADLEYDARQDQARVDLSAGRWYLPGSFTTHQMRRPAAWAASLREYQHDLHVATWRKSDGPLGGSLENTSGQVVEWDDRDQGGAGCAAGFTTLRTYGNGPEGGVFVAVSVTGADESQMRSYTHNMSVANYAQTLVQSATENVAIGQSLVLNADGTATADSIKAIEMPVNALLQNRLLTNLLGEGPRASSALFSIDPSTLYNVPEPIMVTTTELLLNGTVHSVVNTIKVARGA